MRSSKLLHRIKFCLQKYFMNLLLLNLFFPVAWKLQISKIFGLIKGSQKEIVSKMEG